MGGKKKKTTIGYKYFMGLFMGLCRGPVDAIRQIRVGDKIAWTGKATGNSSINISQPALFGGDEQEGGIDGTLQIMMGAPDQLRNDSLAAMLGGMVSAFRGVTTTFFDGMVCAMSPYPKEWSYLVQKTKAGWHNDECWYPEKCEIWMSSMSIGNEQIGPLSGGWRYKVVTLADSSDYSSSIVDDSNWALGQMPFASSPGHPYAAASGFPAAMNTKWPLDTGLWLRKSFNVAYVSDVSMTIFIDNLAKVWVNGVLILDTTDTTRAASKFTIPSEVLRSGANVIAIYGADDAYSPVGDYAYAATRVDLEDTDLPIYGINPAHILRRLYTDPSIGRGLDAALRLDESSWIAAADTFFNEGMGLCMKWSRSDSVANFASEVINHAGAAVYTSRKTGKIVLKAIRGDYDLNDLPLFTPDTGLLGFDDDEATAQSSGINEIIVNWTNVLGKTDAAVREKNLGAILAAGGVTVTESVNYPGIPTESLARRIARRDLKAKSGFIKRLTVRLDRGGRDIMPGHVFRISDPSRGIANMVLRAGRVEFGTITSGAITVTALQDVFGLPATVYRDPEENAYNPPDATPRAPQIQGAMEATYRDMVQAMNAADLAALPDGAGYLHAAAVRPTALSQSFALQTRVQPAAFISAADMASFCPGGRLATPLGYLDTTAVLQDASALNELVPGTAALIGSEIVRVDAIDVATATLTIARGCIDTVPAQHAVGTAVLCYDNWGCDAATEYTAGVGVDVALLTNTGAGQLPLASAPVRTVTFTNRAARPYPPAKVKLNDKQYPDSISGDVVATWVHRNRLTQADILVDSNQSGISPEDGTSYIVAAYNDGNNAVLFTDTVAGTKAVIPADVLVHQNRIEVHSIRDGLKSYQGFSLSFLSEDVAPVLGARFWRLYFTEPTLAFGTYPPHIQLAELEFNGVQAQGGTPFASDSVEAPPTFGLSFAFDGIRPTTHNGVWDVLYVYGAYIGYEFPDPIVVDSVSIHSRAHETATVWAPRGWIVQSSVDGASWTNEWSVSGLGSWGEGVTRKFDRPV